MIELKNICKLYDIDGTKTEALSDVSFSVDTGEFVAIIGPSGSGKSTLMHIMGALDLPSSGTYSLNNQRVDELDDDSLAEIRNKEIGFIFQSYNLLPRMSALRNVLIPMMYADVPKDTRLIRAKNALGVVGLANKLHNLPNQLSGGQKQRVAIARALSMQPSILLADEPTGNLPTKQSNEIIDLFEELNNKGNTILIITHNDDIAKRAKRIITLVDGKIVKDVRSTR